jgi:hypothetical protein
VAEVRVQEGESHCRRQVNRSQHKSTPPVHASKVCCGYLFAHRFRITGKPKLPKLRSRVLPLRDIDKVGRRAMQGILLAVVLSLLMHVRHSYGGIPCEVR